MPRRAVEGGSRCTTGPGRTGRRWCQRVMWSTPRPARRRASCAPLSPARRTGPAVAAWRAAAGWPGETPGRAMPTCARRPWPGGRASCPRSGGRGLRSMRSVEVGPTPGTRRSCSLEGLVDVDRKAVEVRQRDGRLGVVLVGEEATVVVGHLQLVVVEGVHALQPVHLIEPVLADHGRSGGAPPAECSERAGRASSRRA